MGAAIGKVWIYFVDCRPVVNLHMGLANYHFAIKSALSRLDFSLNLPETIETFTAMTGT
jgi:hypothetical protein